MNLFWFFFNLALLIFNIKVNVPLFDRMHVAMRALIVFCMAYQGFYCFVYLYMAIVHGKLL